MNLLTIFSKTVLDQGIVDKYKAEVYKCVSKGNNIYWG